MLVPVSWLREFTPYEGTAQALGEKLTMLGLELEDIVNPFAGLKDIRVGFVAQCVAHPDSDHMHCCRVDLGEGTLVDIVCGAPNVAEGQKVAVAPVGATLPDGTVIRQATLRGQPSNGMICSERELCLSEDHGGILVLPDSLDTGHTLIAALGLDTEVLDLDITPNRGDCLSILGVARETAAAYGLPFHVPDLPLILDKEAPEIEVPIQIDDSALCWLYSGRIVQGVSSGISPLRLRCRLQAVGVRAISNIVDVTNYVMMECGQPLHAFDLDKLQGRRIIVRSAKEGERLITLDGKERILSPDDLCICDIERPVALAGVMGGLNSEITQESSHVFIESAVFNPRNIRRTSRKLGLQSEASFRFERGIDQRRTIWALDRTCSMMTSICGGYVRRGFSVAEPKPFLPRHIEFRPSASDALLGVTIAAEQQKRTLESLGCAVEEAVREEWVVIQPSWRHDLEREADLIEEVGRVYGLDKIEPVLPPVQRKLDESLTGDSTYKFQQLIRRWGAGLGLHEAINYSFTGEKELDALAESAAKRLAIFNPLSEDQGVLRTCLAPGLLRDLANNLAFGSQSIRLFELARAFSPNPDAETGVEEKPLLGILLSGARHDRQWPHREEYLDYADLKGALWHLASYLHVAEPKLKTRPDHPWLAPCVDIFWGDRPGGFMGRVKPALAKAYNAQKDVWICELDLELLRLLHHEATVLFQPLPVYPAVRRDITVGVADRIRVEDILEKIQLLDLPILEGAVLQDCFLNPGQKERNLTFRLTFRHGGRTLKDAEADKEREKIAEYLRKELGAHI